MCKVSRGDNFVDQIRCVSHNRSVRIGLMGVNQMTVDCPLGKGVAELNNHLRDEEREIRGGIMGDGQGLSEEDESRINESIGNDNDGWVENVQVCKNREPEEQGWQGLLPFRSLKVLLVESDDATRRLISSLLKNCGYAVITAENGLEAWKILEDLTNQIDMVLTEAILPCLSGIGLLCKIMNHKTCKTIPVIMMSSHDSMSVVFKCLSKGAVYYLEKPIRKNELQNLWQHVWRKCHSSSGSGSGSESGIVTQKSNKYKSAEASGNNSESNDEDDIRSTGLNMDGSDNGSGTQSSWTMRAAEVERPKPTSSPDQLADPPDSSRPQVNYPRPEGFGNNWVPVTATKEVKERDGEPENASMGKDLEIRVPGIPALETEESNVKALDSVAAGIDKEKLIEMNFKKENGQLEKKQLDLVGNELNGNVRIQASNSVGVMTDSNYSPTVFDIQNGLSKDGGKKGKAIRDPIDQPSLELSLKRPRNDEGTCTNLHEQNVLRHSDQHSAFSRYNAASTANQPPTKNVCSSSPLEKASKAAKTELVQALQFNTNSTPPSQFVNGSTKNNDIGLTARSVFIKPMVSSDHPSLKSTVKYLQHPKSDPTSFTQPPKSGVISFAPPAVQNKADTAMSSNVLGQVRGTNQQVQVQHHHHHYHHHHHHVHNKPQQQLANQDDELLKNRAAASAQCGSSNVFSAPFGSDACNNKLNGSTSGSNGQSGSCGGSNIESNNGLALTGKAGESIEYLCRCRDQTRLQLRVAALNKFRQKRKDRCYKKKVRYQSRKTLADQRPRVRGQFVLTSGAGK